MKTKALDLCLRYMQRQINSGAWKPNERIPTITFLEKNINASRGTIRKAIAKLERDKIIDNQGSLGFILRSNKIISLKKQSLTKFYLNELKINMKMLKLLKNGGQQFDNFIIKYSETNNSVYFINGTEGRLKTVSVNTLFDIFNNPIELKDVLNATGLSFQNIYNKYKEQQSLYTLARTVIKNKKQLGITNG